MIIPEWFFAWKRGGFTKWLAASALVGLAAIGGAWIWALNSDAYESASRAVLTAPEVSAEFGPAIELSLRSFDLNSPRSSFRFAIKGEKASGIVVVTQGKSTKWEIEKVAKTSK